MNLILYSVKRFYEMMKILRVAIFAQICYHEAQVARGHYPLLSFVGHPLEQWISSPVRKVGTRFRKSPAGVIRSPLNDFFHENHKD